MFPCAYLPIQYTVIVAFRCGKCGMVFDSKERLDRHRQVHGRKPKISEAGGINFDQVGG